MTEGSGAGPEGNLSAEDPKPPWTPLVFALSHPDDGDLFMTNPSRRRRCAIHPTGAAFEVTDCDLKELFTESV